MIEYPRESVDFQALDLTVTIAGTTTTVNAPVSYCLVPYDRAKQVPRPTVWLPTETLDGQVGFVVKDLTPGNYRVWVKAVSGEESPVRLCDEVLLIS